MKSPVKPEDALPHKVNLYMQSHVLPWFEPEEIQWWFSLSGGKDSFAMALAVRDWYASQCKKFDANGFYISQWSARPAESIARQLPWLRFVHIDAQKFMKHKLKYRSGDQAPCRECADIRRDLNDGLILSETVLLKKPIFLARGLHFTDMAISLLWRFLMGYDPVSSLIAQGKGKPLSKMWENVYLAKPLYYAREFESQAYSASRKVVLSCCGCPACRYPSRRDIIEETVAPLFESPLWEFSTPRISELFNKIENAPRIEEVMAASAEGRECKIPHLPPDFPSFAVEYFQNQLQGCRKRHDNLLDFTQCLDNLGMEKLLFDKQTQNEPSIPAPAMLSQDVDITRNQSLLIAALGPFWGAIALSNKHREEAFSLQENIFHLRISENWNHVHELLTAYYGEERSEQNAGANLDFRCISCSDMSISSV